MNSWLANDQDVAVKKHVFMAEERPEVMQNARRKRTEVVIHDQDEEEEPHEAKQQVRSKLKSDELAPPDLVRAVSPVASSASSASSSSVTEAQRYAFYLVQQYLFQQNHHEILKTLEAECNQLNDKKDDMQPLHTKFSRTDPSTQNMTCLEQFLMTYNTQVHHYQLQTTTTTTKPKSTKTKARKKPVLQVITTPDSEEEVEEAHDGYNRLGRPGSTPKQPIEPSFVLGEPGSTPKARVSDLMALGIDDEEVLDPPLPPQNMTSTESSYILSIEPPKANKKSVQLGEPGSTPKKEYVFFRETPPAYVTETVEEAKEIFEKLVQDPDFQQQAIENSRERFVELQSSEVAKYKLGQRVENLGVQRDVSGIVAKIYGSRQCGTSGPGTIVIDTMGDDTTSSSDNKLLSEEDVEVMNQLTA